MSSLLLFFNRKLCSVTIDFSHGVVLYTQVKEKPFTYSLINSAYLTFCTSVSLYAQASFIVLFHHLVCTFVGHNSPYHRKAKNKETLFSLFFFSIASDALHCDFGVVFLSQLIYISMLVLSEITFPSPFLRKLCSIIGQQGITHHLKKKVAINF